MTLPAIVARLAPSHEQEQPILADRGDIAVTAGAGTGKTRTLVGRYLRLLADGVPLDAIIAITFTRRAAREMRGRIREEVRRYVDSEPPDLDHWRRIYDGLDAARIETIHSLCSDILRQHPVEAGIDPLFGMLDEGRQAMERALAVDSALAWAADDPEAAALFDYYPERALRKHLDAAVKARQEIEESQARLAGDTWERWRNVICASVLLFVNAPAVTQEMAKLIAARDDGLVEDALRVGDKRGPLVQEALAAWDDLAAALAAGDLDTTGHALAQWRGGIGGNSGRSQFWGDSGVLEACKSLRQSYDALTVIKLFGGGASCDREMAERVLPAFLSVYGRAQEHYRQARATDSELDFDDLESLTLALLRGHPEVRDAWQLRIQAILVDEFQDTNERQRDLIHALDGERGCLFIVGDAKQSIYGFRGADVTVFRRERDRIEKRGGTFELQETYRAHPELVAAQGALLRPVLGDDPDPARPYVEPFAATTSARGGPATGECPPHVEVLLGAGAREQDAPSVAALALAARLAELVSSGIEIERTDPDSGQRALRPLEYGDVAILCRASTSFSSYEDALEEAGIPYLTVSGRGFYARPEVRDLLNALQALDDPLDDLALVGLLRSPAFALDDMTLYKLRRAAHEQSAASLWEFIGALLGPDGWPALGGGNLMALDGARERLVRAAAIVTALRRTIGRQSVASLLKDYVDATGYRAALLAREGHRAVGNIDKLMQDASAAALSSVGEFIDYVASLRDVSSREGEAHALARGAVQIMSIHQAKGLEFPVVVLGDAGRQPRGDSGLLVDADLGLVLPPPQTSLDDDAEASSDKQVSLAYSLAAARSRDRGLAEEDRLLYVALTRAEEHLIISSSADSRASGQWKVEGMLARLDLALGLDAHLPAGNVPVDGPLTADWEMLSPDGKRVAVRGAAWGAESAPGAARASGIDRVDAGTLLPDEDLVRPLRTPAPAEGVEADAPVDRDPPRRVWRVVPRQRRVRARAWVVGNLVHRALSLWLFPDRGDEFQRWAEAEVRDCGVISTAELRDALASAQRLLRRFVESPLYAEMTAAGLRLMEVPYSIEIEGGEVDTGVIDALYRRGDTWHLVEFKTDHIQHAWQLEELLAREDYRPQVARYVHACRLLLPRDENERAPTIRPVLCFLDYERGMHLVPQPGVDAP